MDLRKLRHILVLAEEGNFVRASQRLHITQSALTRSVQALEEELALKLFDRLTRGVVPTTAGREVLARARRLVQHASGFEKDIALLRNNEIGSVVFGVGPMLVPSLPGVISQLIQLHPRLDIRAEIKPAPQLLHGLLAEQLEFFIADAVAIEPTQEITVRSLAALPIDMFVKNNHPLIGNRGISLDDISAFPLAASGYWGNHQPSPIAGASQAGASRHGYISCEDVNALKQIALNTDAVILATQWAMEPEFGRGVFQKVQLHHTVERLESNVCLVALANHSLSPVAQHIIGAIERDIKAVYGNTKIKKSARPRDDA